MKPLSLLVVVVVAVLSFASAQPPSYIPRSGDWREAIESADTAAPDSQFRVLADVLKHSKVPDEQEAMRRASPLDADARARLRVSALLRLAKPVNDLGAAGDFVWEVRVLWPGHDLADVIWVGVSTGMAKSIVPQ